MIRDSPARRRSASRLASATLPFGSKRSTKAVPSERRNWLANQDSHQFTLGNEGEVRWQDSREDEAVEVALVICDENAAAALRQLIQTLNTRKESSRSQEETRSNTKKSSAARDAPLEATTPSQTMGAKDRNEQAGIEGRRVPLWPPVETV